MKKEPGREAGAQPQYTPQQSAAILRRGVSIALSAGAGCGKTFVLTHRFLAGIRPATTDGQAESELHQVVAFTFTDRAAREMRDRIRNACHQQLHSCDVQHVPHWLGILRGLDAARISTIHSYCTSLLRSQAVEAGLDPQFSVLDTDLADSLLRRVVRDTLHRLIERRDPDAMEFVVQFGLERVQEQLRSLTLQRFQLNSSDFEDITPELLAAAWIQKWHSEIVPRQISRFRESPLVAQVLRGIAGNPSRNARIIERIAFLNTTLGLEAPWNDAPQTLAAIKEYARVVGGGGKKEWVSDERQEEVKQLFEALRSSADKLLKKLEFREEDVVISTDLACRAVRLLKVTAANFEAAKRAQGVLDFDDLLLLARNLLRDNESVRTRVAAGIRLLMVDEFQDTDPVQADLVRSLCGNGLTSGKLFMVGDRKQSIYRFRRADPTVFARMSDELPPTGRLPLNVNFRSQPAVLNFVNHLFKSAMPDYETLKPFRDLQQSPLPAVEFLFATFDGPTTTIEASALPEAPTEEDESSPKAAQLRAREADWIARRIVELLHDETPRIRSEVKDESGLPVLRRAEPGDIVILFRALSNVQEYEAALRKYDLDYYLVGGKAFFAQQEVFDLLNLCRYLDDPDDLVGLVGVLRSPFFNLSDDAIQALVSPPESSSTHPSTQQSSDGDAPLASESGPQGKPLRSLHQALALEPPPFLPENQRQRIRFAAEVLNDLRGRKDRTSLSQLLTESIERTGYDASLLSEFLGERKLANLRKLVEKARQFERGDLFTLKDFVTRLHTSILEETSEEFATTQPESGNVIRLMTIHQSKGLEFPIVFVADIDRKSPPNQQGAVLHPELGPLIRPPDQFGVQAHNLGLQMHKFTEEEAEAEETVRLFYVACTRAADYLILSAGLDPAREAQSPWRKLLESRFDLSTGLLKFDSLLGSSESATGDRESIPDVRIHRKPAEIPRVKTLRATQISLAELPTQLLSTQPAEFPQSARVFPRDSGDLTTLSVSKLEEKDAEQTDTVHYAVPQEMEHNDELILDRDLSTVLGTLVHAVLERFCVDQPENWPTLLDEVVRQSQDSIHRDVVQQARTMLSRFFSSSFAAELSTCKQIHREINFVLPWQAIAPATERWRGEPTIAGVIDLLAEFEDGWHLFDYKTGEFPNHASAEQLLAPYEVQLGLYAFAVEQWFGVVPREISLIVFRPEVRRISLPWSAEHWKRIQHRILRAVEAMKHDNHDSDIPHLLQR